MGNHWKRMWHSGQLYCSVLELLQREQLLWIKWIIKWILEFCAPFSQNQPLKHGALKKKREKKGGGVAMLDKSTVFKIKWMNLIHLRMSQKKKIKNNVDHFKKSAWKPPVCTAYPLALSAAKAQACGSLNFRKQTFHNSSRQTVVKWTLSNTAEWWHMVYSQPAAHLLVELSGIGQGVAKGDSAIIVACELYNNYQFSSSRRLIFLWTVWCTTWFYNFCSQYFNDVMSSLWEFSHLYLSSHVTTI